MELAEASGPQVGRATAMHKLALNFNTNDSYERNRVKRNNNKMVAGVWTSCSGTWNWPRRMGVRKGGIELLCTHTHGRTTQEDVLTGFVPRDAGSCQIIADVISRTVCNIAKMTIRFANVATLRYPGVPFLQDLLRFWRFVPTDGCLWMRLLSSLCTSNMSPSPKR